MATGDTILHCDKCGKTYYQTVGHECVGGQDFSQIPMGAFTVTGVYDADKPNEKWVDAGDFSLMTREIERMDERQFLEEDEEHAKIRAWIDALDYASGFISGHVGKANDRVKTLHELGNFLSQHIDAIERIFAGDDFDNTVKENAARVTELEDELKARDTAQTK